MIEIFPDAQSLAAAAAAAVVDRLSYRLRLKGSASLVATGGRSPGAVYDILSAAALDWSKVSITLSDERFVDPASEGSNERLVRERLLQGRAARAQFLGLRGTAPTPQAAAAEASAALRDWPAFEVVLLGMGEDGHVASLFPGSPALYRRSRGRGPPSGPAAPQPHPAAAGVVAAGDHPGQRRGKAARARTGAR